MTLDETGRRAGVSLRERFDDLPAPPLAETTVVPSRRQGALAGVAVVVAIAIGLALLISSRDEQRPAGRAGGTWRAIDTDAAFGRRGRPASIVWDGARFVAIGSIQRPDRFCISACNAPAVWTSDDGERWERQRDARFPSNSAYITSSVARGQTLVAATDAGELWRSTDATTWRRTGVTGATDGIGPILSVRPRGRFMAVAVPSRTFRSTWSHTVWTSSDGGDWTQHNGNGTADHPIGLLPGALLGASWLTLGSMTAESPDLAAPAVFTSVDGVLWTRIPGTNAPERFSRPLASNHRRTRVLGIQYEAPNTFGGRLWSTPDGRTWTEIRSFHAQMPVANPDHLVQAGRWWVLGGNTGTPDGHRRSSMWASPDLQRWYEMPAPLRGAKTSGSAVLVTAGNGRVVGLAPSESTGGPSAWVWSPPD